TPTAAASGGRYPSAPRVIPAFPSATSASWIPRARAAKCSAAATRNLEDQDRAEIVDVGERRAGHEQIAETGEERVGVVAVEMISAVQPQAPCPLQGVWRRERTGVGLDAVDAVGVGGERPDVALALQRESAAKQELAGASAAAPLLFHRHRRLAA